VCRQLAIIGLILHLLLASATAHAAAAPAVWTFFPASGAAGTTVTIVGTGLAGITSVQVNGSAATFTALSATRLQAVIPPAASSGAISVTASGGTATSSATFAVAGTSLRYVVPAASPAISLANVSGRTITSLAIGADPSITLTNCSDITILACDLRSIVVNSSSNVSICNCYIHDSANNGVQIQSSSAVTVQGNRMERVMTGVYAVQCGSGGIRILGNYVQDVQGPLPRGQLVQFDNVIQGSGTASIIAYNYAINYMGQSTPEDMINIYESQGTAATPILVEGNFLSGDPVHGSQGKSSSGSGIMIGDAGGNYLTARNNILLSPGQVGIGIPSGSNVMVAGNMIMGLQSNVSNIGMYAWNQYSGTPGPVTVLDNTIAWKESSGAENDWWAGGGFTSIAEGPDDFGDWAAFTPLPAGPTLAPLPPLPYGNPALYPWAVTSGPEISSFTPASGTVGTSITISGSLLSGATSVTVNGTVAMVTSDAAGSITAAVPAGATSGPIAVVTPAGTATSATSFTVIPAAPVISSFSPGSGTSGSSLTITGSNLGGASAVTINGSAASVVFDAANQIMVTVPAAASSGHWAVTTAGGTATSTGTFTVVPPAPAISAFSPASGATGSSLTITGSNLGAATAVTINGSAASVVSDGANQIVVTVPAAATSGHWAVTTAGGTATSSASFTMLPPAPVISAFSPASGAIGSSLTITGSNLGGATAVSINGSAASVVSDAANQIVVTVPSAATSGHCAVTTAGGTATSSASFTVTAPASAAAPAVASPASGPASAVTGTSAALAVLGGPAGSEPAYTYTWSVTSHPAGGSATFTPNGSNASQHALITVDRAGTWLVQVSIADPATHVATISGPLSITVDAVATTLAVTPATSTIAAGGSALYSAEVEDQFGQPLATQPAMHWSASSGGSISTAGAFTAADTATGPITVTATSGSLSGTAAVTVDGDTPVASNSSGGGGGCGHGASVSLLLLSLSVAMARITGRSSRPRHPAGAMAYATENPCGDVVSRSGTGR
jgi:hypothetical protein